MERPLSKAAQKALSLINEQGYAFSGYNIRNGARFLINARVLDALKRRGLIETSVGPDGGMYARKKGTN